MKKNNSMKINSLATPKHLIYFLMLNELNKYKPDNSKSIISDKESDKPKYEIEDLLVEIPSIDIYDIFNDYTRRDIDLAISMLYIFKKADYRNFNFIMATESYNKAMNIIYKNFPPLYEYIIIKNKTDMKYKVIKDLPDVKYGAIGIYTNGWITFDVGNNKINYPIDIKSHLYSDYFSPFMFTSEDGIDIFYHDDFYILVDRGYETKLYIDRCYETNLYNKRAFFYAGTTLNDILSTVDKYKSTWRIFSKKENGEKYVKLG